MRTLFLLRGAPGCGKSTWIEQNHLSPFTLSADAMRQIYGGLVYTADGKPVISVLNDSAVWKELLKRLEARMDRGEFLIVDATHYKASLLQQYKKLIAKYRYRAYVVNFTDITLETCLERNAGREEYKRVPADVIRKMYAVFTSSYKEVSNRYKIISPAEAVAMIKSSLLFDYDCYEKMVVFGDIHGCYSPLEAYFRENPMNDKTAYIFCGDYLDRGIENRKVLEFLLSVMDKPNVLLLEGNHERWIRMYAEGTAKPIPSEDEYVLKKYVDKEFWKEYNNNRIRNRGFIKYTIPEIRPLPVVEIKKLCRKFGQMAYVSFKGKNYFVTHGGFAALPSLLVPAVQMIDGTGKYEDVDILYDTWMHTTGDKEILVHGHRNVLNYPAKARERCYNLCSGVEYGDPLRIMEVTADGIAVKEYPVLVYNHELQRERVSADVSLPLPTTDNELLTQLNASSLVNKRVFENGIVSYNFTREAFYDARWNHLTCTARGLFVKDNKVVARSYNKFFNWGERPETESRALKTSLQFPVKAYAKENGFLAMVTSFDGNLLCCSKGSITSEFASWIKDAIALHRKESVEAMRKYAEEHNCTFVFECYDVKHDPHIIPCPYHYPELVLLDVVENSFTYKKLSYEELQEMGKRFGFPVKRCVRTFESWEELYGFYKEVKDSFDPYNDHMEEGWVFEDANGMMVKYKTPNYVWWKKMRSLMTSIQSNKTVKPVYANEAEVRVFALMDNLKRQGRLDGMSILDVEQSFWSIYKDKANKGE